MGETNEQRSSFLVALDKLTLFSYVRDTPASNYRVTVNYNTDWNIGYVSRTLLKMNNKMQVMNSSPATIDQHTMYLFARNPAGWSGDLEIAHVKINYCKIYKDDFLIRNFIPCLDPSGKPCLYDTITKRPFYNNGTGEFLYG